MKKYKFDYDSSTFVTINTPDRIKYFTKVNEHYVEVKKEIYDVCKSSYNKLRYTYKQEEAKFVIYYENKYPPLSGFGDHLLHLVGS
ncbi:MAG: hypothetical protein IJ356_09580 [Erysipelotrichaceae bacterium]|nr:hypothetical protein [Erysipelotrichaceae bacterium]